MYSFRFSNTQYGGIVERSFQWCIDILEVSHVLDCDAFSEYSHLLHTIIKHPEIATYLLSIITNTHDFKFYYILYAIIDVQPISILFYLLSMEITCTFTCNVKLALSYLRSNC